jgi:hypothetical protein
MTDTPLPAPRPSRRLHRPHPPRSLLTGLSAVARSSVQRLPDVEHLAILARRLVPVAVVLFLAQGFFLAGFFNEPLLNLPLGILTVTALVAITALDYRADLRNRDFVDDLLRRSREAAEAARRREASLLDDIRRLVAGGVDAATPPVLLGSSVAVMGPLLVDLLTTPSTARGEQLLEELEQTAVEACAELVDHAGEDGRAVLYRRIGRRFEPQWPQGAWPTQPLPATGTSDEANRLRVLLRQRRVVQATTDADHARPQLNVAIPLHVGRRSVGVVVAQRPGDRLLEPRELEAMIMVVDLLTVGIAGTHGTGGPRRAKASDRARARWARRRTEIDSVVPARVIRGEIATQLQALVETPDARRTATAFGRAPAESPASSP